MTATDEAAPTGTDAASTGWSPSLALREAVAAQSWSRVVTIIESSWSHLLLERPAALARALRKTPVAALAHSPLALAIRDLLQVQPPTRTPLPRLLCESDAAAIGASAHGRRAVELNLAAMVILRRRGRLAEASSYRDQLRTMQIAAQSAHSPETAGLAALAYGQSGILSELLGDSSEAAVEFREAYRRAPASEFSFSAEAAAARLALSFARLGSLKPASAWLVTAGEPAAVPRLPASTSRALMRLTDALLALARLDREGASAALAALGSSLDHDEYWPFVVEARTKFAVTWGDRAALTSARHAVRARAASAGEAGIVATLLVAAEVNLLIALGQGDEAHAIVSGRTDRHWLLDGPRARLALLTGDARRARDLARAALDRPMLPPPLRVEMKLINAVASYRLGRIEVAIDALRRAVHQASSTGLLQPFTALPRADLIALAQYVPEAQVLLARDEILAAHRPDDQALALVSLTEREQLILAHLSRGQAVAQIAAVLRVSINTIRTQRHSLYQKLSVTSRSEALTAATGLGLIKTPETHRS